MDNRRNYYRILHVQFDAPPAVIKASYRTIMQKLRAHPDLGGDEWNASLINEARNVLLDPALRADYDLQLRKAGLAGDPGLDQAQTQSDVGGELRPQYEPKESPRADDTADDAKSTAPDLKLETLITNLRPLCPFCRHPVSHGLASLQAYRAAQRCNQCRAPLKIVDCSGLEKPNESRKVNRSELAQIVSVWDKWPSNSGYDGTVCDWSTSGCCIQTRHALSVNAVILLLSPAFDAIATVLYQSPDTFYGLEFLTLEVNMSPGSVFVSSA